MLEVITLEETRWDEIVKNFIDHDIYYLSGYVKGFYLHGDGIPLLFYYHDDDLSAINVVMKRDIADDKNFNDLIEKEKYYDLATPYGYGGWLIQGNGDKNKIFEQFTKWCLENKIISEVIRFHPILNNQEPLREIYDVLDLGKTIAMDLNSEDLIWSNFTTQNRGKIKKAIKNEVSIHHDLNPDTLQDFKKIYEITMNKDHATDYYYFKDDFYDSVVNDLKDSAEIFYARWNDMTIAATIILKCNERLTYHLSGVITEYRNVQATNLMLYEVAKWGANNGFKTFHLGGGVGSKEDDLYIFKKSFNKKDAYQYSIGRKIYNEELYNYLLDLRKEVENPNYFPKYRG